MAKPVQQERSAITVDHASQYSFTKGFRQYWTLLRISLAEYRSMWLFYIIFSFVWPWAFMFFASAIVGTGNKEQVIFLLGGNIATSVAFGPMYILMNKMGLGREMHEFDYWARLPLPKAIFVSAFISGSLLLALPGLLGVYIIGSQLLGFSPLNVLIFLPIIILGAVPLAAIGATLGSYIPSGQVANVIANTVLLFIGFLSPMFFPLQLLPEPLRVIAWLLPTTYLADALRSLLGSYQGTHFLVDILFLSICTIVSLFLVQWKLDWRIEA